MIKIKYVFTGDIYIDYVLMHSLVLVLAEIHLVVALINPTRSKNGCRKSAFTNQLKSLKEARQHHDSVRSLHHSTPPPLRVFISSAFTQAEHTILESGKSLQ